MVFSRMVVVLTVAVACGCGASSPRARHVRLLGDRTFPEGIAADGERGDLFVGGLASGDIQRVRGESAEYFKRSHEDGLLDVIGLAVDSSRHRLWVCSTSFADPTIAPSLVVFDTRDRARLASLPIPSDGAPHFLNDVDVDTDGNAYATDSLAPIIWTVPADLSRIETFVSDPVFSVDPAGFNLNGIAVTRDDRYIVASVPSMSDTGHGKLFRVSMQDRSVTEIALSADFLGADGLVVVDEQRMISSGAPPGLHWLEFDTEYTHAQVTPVPGFESEFALPTTSAIVGGRLWVVSSQLDHFVTAVFGDRGPPTLPFEIVGIDLGAL